SMDLTRTAQHPAPCKATTTHCNTSKTAIRCCRIAFPGVRSAKRSYPMNTQTRPPRRLKNMKITEVSSVDRGTGESVGIVLAKHAAPDIAGANEQLLKNLVNEDTVAKAIDKCVEALAEDDASPTTADKRALLIETGERLLQHAKAFTPP